MTLLAVRTYTLTAGTWTPIMLSGRVSKAWLTFNGDIVIGSSTTDPTQQQTLSFAQGNEFMMDLPGEVQLGDAPGTVLCYATAVSGTVTCTVYGLDRPMVPIPL